MEETIDFNKIGVIDKTLLKDIKLDMIPEFISQNSIYHYTSINGIKDILNNKKLWFTHIDYMNDRDEVIAGAEQLKKVGLENCAGEYSRIIKSEEEKIKNQDHKAFVCCFSLKRDELAMWNYYTKDPHNQGYNLGFDYRRLIISILQNNPELHGCKFSFGKVDYCIDEENYISKTYHQSLINMSDTINRIVSLIKEGKVEKKEISENKSLPFVKYYGNEPIFRQTTSLDVLYLMKRPCFSNEDEFRIVIQVTEHAMSELKKQKKYKFRTSNGLLIPYLDLDIDLSSVTGITLSPTINSDLAERSVNDYCEFCGIDVEMFAEGIIKSQIPVRF